MSKDREENSEDSADSPECSPAPEARFTEDRRGILGLALGGGVARGWAHIGAVRRLDELGFTPDIVAGTSVGALVGGFWRAGRLDALEDWALSLTKTRMLSYFDIVLNGSGLMGGKRLEKIMARHLPPTDIKDLPGKFIAVTAELATGHEVWLTEGDLGEAMQAAYALPGVFPPKALGGRWLIDGALVNPLPVSACRAFGARIVVAIGLHADAFNMGVAQRKDKFRELADDGGAELEEASKGNLTEKLMLRRLFHAGNNAPGVGSVMLASFNILMDRITRSRLAGDPPDVLVTPHVAHVPLLDFDQAEELIAQGRKAIDEAMPQIESAIEYMV
ncbi:patatin-like phospholipase family protein [Hyphococcus flavus]|uniref:Patatin-like phospholipase family protein n=1 Tax=Hyphococcus flavus TaxID=1866326 RepID=A0AAF0CFR1_9PROT|nr:patatin-like phospholipase family protein [Hyphococcus flavus]WDI31649.1 patatin-like phospholipase family protein [Hyphococcus flavus]